MWSGSFTVSLLWWAGKIVFSVESDDSDCKLEPAELSNASSRCYYSDDASALGFEGIRCVCCWLLSTEVHNKLSAAQNANKTGAHISRERRPASVYSWIRKLLTDAVWIRWQILSFSCSLLMLANIGWLHYCSYFLDKYSLIRMSSLGRRYVGCTMKQWAKREVRCHQLSVTVKQLTCGHQELVHHFLPWPFIGLMKTMWWTPEPCSCVCRSKGFVKVSEQWYITCCR